MIDVKLGFYLKMIVVEEVKKFGVYYVVFDRYDEIILFFF